MKDFILDLDLPKFPPDVQAIVHILNEYQEILHILSYSFLIASSGVKLQKHFSNFTENVFLSNFLCGMGRQMELYMDDRMIDVLKVISIYVKKYKKEFDIFIEETTKNKIYVDVHMYRNRYAAIPLSVPFDETKKQKTLQNFILKFQK